MPRLTFRMKGLFCALLLAGIPVVCQQQSQNLPAGPAPKPQSQSQSQQSVPDAPQPKPNQFPENAPPAPKNVHPDEPAPDAAPTPEAVTTPTPSRGGVSGSRDELFRLTVAVNFVQIP